MGHDFHPWPHSPSSFGCGRRRSPAGHARAQAQSSNAGVHAGKPERTQNRKSEPFLLFGKIEISPRWRRNETSVKSRAGRLVRTYIWTCLCYPPTPKCGYSCRNSRWISTNPKPTTAVVQPTYVCMELSVRPRELLLLLILLWPVGLTVLGKAKLLDYCSLSKNSLVVMHSSRSRDVLPPPRGLSLV